jgi:outer membrane protein assembly factor BamB/beta-lactamase regulating signal transducer with metallopeptidase domain
MTGDLDRLAELAWDQLWQVSAVALVVAVLVHLFGGRRPHLAYLLWLLVIAKCLTPPLWSSPTGVFSWARLETRQATATLEEATPAHSALVTSEGTATIEDTAETRFVETPLLSESPARDDEIIATHAAHRSEELAGDDHSPDNTSIAAQGVVPERTKSRWSLSWPVVLALVWGCGAVACTAVVVAKYLLCGWAVWNSSRPADKHLETKLTRLSERLGVRRQVHLLVTKRSLGPAVFGVFRPTILLPESLLAPEFAKRLEPILAHELIHFRRGDTLLGVLQLAAQILWWFHPLVWWASREATRERERCCDEEAVAGLKCEPDDYAQTLLDVLRSKRRLEPLFAQPGVRPVDITTRRLQHIMQRDHSFHRRTPIWCWVTVALAAALLLPGGALIIELHANASDTTQTALVAEPTSDWPQYGGSPSRNNVARDRNLPTTWNLETGENIKWTAQLGTSVYSSPIIADGKVLIGSNNGAEYSERLPKNVDASCLLCFDAETGEFLWQHANEKLETGRVHDWPTLGICSTSCVEDDRVYYVNNRNELVCLDLEGFHDGEDDGEEDARPKSLDEADVVWRLDLMHELGVSQHNQAICSVTIAGNLILSNTSHGLGVDHVTQPDDAPSFIAVDKRSGRLVWQDNSPGGNLLHGQWSSPAYAVIDGVGQAIFAGGDGWLYSFGVRAMRRGKTKLLWKFDCNPKESEWTLGGRGARNNAIAIPVIHKNRVYYATGQDPEHGEGPGRVWCIDATKRGDISAELVFNESDPDKPIPHKRIQACEPDKGDLVKPNPNSGVVWHFDKYDGNDNGEIEYGEEMHRSFSSVVIHDGFAVIPDYSGILHCLDAETGKQHWNYDMLASVWCTPLIADGKIYVGDEEGDVAIFKLSKEMHLLSESNVDHSVYTTMMSADGTLYIPSVRQLIAVASPRKQPTSNATAGRDWPSWRRTPQNSGVTTGKLPADLKVLWRFDAKAECAATPAIVDGIAYVGDLENSFYAIDIRNGKQLWVTKSEAGFQTSALVLGGRVYVGDATGRMHCMDAKTGIQLWVFDAEAPLAGAANALDGLVVFASEEGTVAALQPDTGELVWKTSAGTQLQSSPALIGKRVIVAGCDHQLHVLDLETGKALLATDIEAPTGSTPAIRDGLAYFGTEGGVLFCVEVETGKIRWRFESDGFGAIRGAAAVTQNFVIVAGRSKNLIAIETATGEVVWKFRSRSSFDSSPVVIDDHVVIGSTDGRLYVLELATGKEMLRYETGGPITGSVAFADGRLVIATVDGVVYCFGDPTKQRNQVVTTNPSDAAPTASDTAYRDATFRIEAIGKKPLQIESSKNKGEEGLTIHGRARITLGAGDDAIIAEADRGLIQGPIFDKTDWSSLRILLEGDAVLKFRSSDLRAKRIRYFPAKRQFQLDEVGTLQLPDDWQTSP